MLISTDYDLDELENELWSGAEDNFSEIRDLIDDDDKFEEAILEYFGVSDADPIDLTELNDFFRYTDIDELKEIFGIEDEEVEESTNFYKTYKSLKERRNRLCEKRDSYTVQPKNKEELEQIIKDTIKEKGNNCDLNFIDTSLITDMSYLFANSKFNGDISEWDVSNVEDMTDMFRNSNFNGDISKWNVSNVEDMD